MSACAGTGLEFAARRIVRSFQQELYRVYLSVGSPISWKISLLVKCNFEESFDAQQEFVSELRDRVGEMSFSLKHAFMEV
jgi:hypothetical protein